MSTSARMTWPDWNITRLSGTPLKWMRKPSQMAECQERTPWPSSWWKNRKLSNHSLDCLALTLLKSGHAALLLPSVIWRNFSLLHSFARETRREWENLSSLLSSPFPDLICSPVLPLQRRRTKRNHWWWWLSSHEFVFLFQWFIRLFVFLFLPDERNILTNRPTDWLTDALFFTRISFREFNEMKECKERLRRGMSRRRLRMILVSWWWERYKFQMGNQFGPEQKATDGTEIKPAGEHILFLDSRQIKKRFSFLHSLLQQSVHWVQVVVVSFLTWSGKSLNLSPSSWRKDDDDADPKDDYDDDPRWCSWCLWEERSKRKCLYKHHKVSKKETKVKIAWNTIDVGGSRDETWSWWCWHSHVMMPTKMWYWHTIVKMSGGKSVKILGKCQRSYQKFHFWNVVFKGRKNREEKKRNSCVKNEFIYAISITGIITETTIIIIIVMIMKSQST